VPQVDPLRDRAHEPQRYQRRRRVERGRQGPPLIRRKPDHRFDERDDDGNDHLRATTAHDGARVGDHEEHEQLIHGPSNRRDLRKDRLTEHDAPQRVQHEEAGNVRERDVKHPHARRDHQAERPDHEVRREVVPPLVAQDRDALGRGEQQRDDREVRGIPEMVLAVAEDVLGRDREPAA